MFKSSNVRSGGRGNVASNWSANYFWARIWSRISEKANPSGILENTMDCGKHPRILREWPPYSEKKKLGNGIPKTCYKNTVFWSLRVEGCAFYSQRLDLSKVFFPCQRERYTFKNWFLGRRKGFLYFSRPRNIERFFFSTNPPIRKPKRACTPKWA